MMEAWHILFRIGTRGSSFLEERDETGSLLIRYVYGDDLISQHRAGTQSYYQHDGLGMHSSGLGRIGMLTDETGAMTDTYRYDAFGNVIARTGTTENPMRFRSKLYDADTGLYYYNARHYNPTIGRFMTPDAAMGNFESPLTQIRQQNLKNP